LLSGGLSTSQITKQEAEHGLSQVFVAIDITKLPGHSTVPLLIENIISDYKQSVPQDAATSITYPGERVLLTREKNLKNGIPVLQEVWDKILKL
jgi:3-dehydro-L-gulonate 2-dehydrogenase